MNDALDRVLALIVDAADEGQHIDQTSLAAAISYFGDRAARWPRPRLTLTPEGRVRAQWADGTMREF